MTNDDAAAVKISDSVISADDLASRLRSVQAELIAPHGSSLDTPATFIDRAHRLHVLWGTIKRPVVERRAGAGGTLAFQIKRITRRLVGWYVDPRFDAQHEIDAELARFASDSAAAIQRLENEVERLQTWNERMQRELRLVRRDTGTSRPCP